MTSATLRSGRSFTDIMLGSRRSMTTGIVLAVAGFGCVLMASPAHAADTAKCATGAVVFSAGVAGTAATDGVAGALGGLGAMLGGEETMHDNCQPAAVPTEIAPNSTVVPPRASGMV